MESFYKCERAFEKRCDEYWDNKFADEDDIIPYGTKILYDGQIWFIDDYDGDEEVEYIVYPDTEEGRALMTSYVVLTRKEFEIIDE